MKAAVLILCLATLCVPAQARRHFAPTFSRPATVQPGFCPTAPSMNGSNITNTTLNSSYGVRRGHGRRRVYWNRFSNGLAPANGIPGYNKALPEKPLPGT